MPQSGVIPGGADERRSDGRIGSCATEAERPVCCRPQRIDGAPTNRPSHQRGGAILLMWAIVP
jgi:hypothetical protein